MKGFAEAQFAHDHRLPPEPEFGYCNEHDTSFEDCWNDHENPDIDNQQAMEDAYESAQEEAAERAAEYRREMWYD